VTGYREQVAQALRAVKVTSSTSYAWFGRRSRRLPEAVSTALSTESARGYLIGILERELYRSFYTQGSPVPMGPDGFGPARTDRKFVETLSGANTGAGGWQQGWRVVDIAQQALLVMKNGLRVQVKVSDCHPSTAGIAVGDAVSVRRPKELRSASPGFYMALGDLEPVMAPDDVEVRLYFNVSADGAVPLMEACTRQLNGAGIPFDFKVVDDPRGYFRCDAAVLYLQSGAVERAREPLRAIASACAPYVGDESPAFARPLAPGLALGEHQRSLGVSFGSVRCRLLADGIVAAHDRGANGLQDRVDAVACCFASHGLDIDAPYLTPGSTARYEL
jgi:HopA1 effector protein family